MTTLRADVTSVPAGIVVLKLPSVARSRPSSIAPLEPAASGER
jgi:hypothetical protein